MSSANMGGGAHYRMNGELQHWDMVSRNGLGYFVGCATKYLHRMGRKGSLIDDLQKALHYLEKFREIARPLPLTGVIDGWNDRYLAPMDPWRRDVFEMIFRNNIDGAITAIKSELDRQLES